MNKICPATIKSVKGVGKKPAKGVRQIKSKTHIAKTSNQEIKPNNLQERLFDIPHTTKRIKVRVRG